MQKRNKKQNRIYLDFASLAPIDAEVKNKMTQALSLYSGNPSALHAEGQIAKKAVSDSRKKIAEMLFAHPDEIIFTSGGTESDNLAIAGVVRAFRQKYQDIKWKPHIITTAIEHSAVLETCKALEKEGIAVSYIRPDISGIISSKDIKEAIRPQTILISVMYANNEIGTIQPITEIAKEIRHYKKTRNLKNTELANYPLFHTDAAQAMNYLLVDLRKLGVDLLSFNGSKIYGPRGAGVLYIKRGTDCINTSFGGNQEFHMRPGTENTSAVIGLVVALEKTLQIKDKEIKRLTAICDYGIQKIQKIFPDVRVNGDMKERLPNNINISFPGISSELLVIELDAKGIAVSSKSACKKDDPDESYVLDALYGKEVSQGKTALSAGETGSIRISLGRTTVKRDMDILVRTLQEIRKKMNPWL